MTPKSFEWNHCGTGYPRRSVRRRRFMVVSCAGSGHHGHGRATDPRAGNPRPGRVGPPTGTAEPPTPGRKIHVFVRAGSGHPRARPSHRPPCGKSTCSTGPGRAIHGQGRATDPRLENPRVRPGRVGPSTGKAEPPTPGVKNPPTGTWRNI